MLTGLKHLCAAVLKLKTLSTSTSFYNIYTYNQNNLIRRGMLIGDSAIYKIKKEGQPHP